MRANGSSDRDVVGRPAPTPPIATRIHGKAGFQTLWRLPLSRGGSQERREYSVTRIGKTLSAEISMFDLPRPRARCRKKTLLQLRRISAYVDARASGIERDTTQAFRPYN